MQVRPINPAPRWTLELPSGGRLPEGFDHVRLLDTIERSGLAIILTMGRGVGSPDLNASRVRTSTSSHV